MGKLIFWAYLGLFVPLTYSGVRTDQVAHLPPLILMFAGAVLPVQHAKVKPPRFIRVKLPTDELLPLTRVGTEELRTQSLVREKPGRAVLGRVLQFRRPV